MVNRAGLGITLALHALAVISLLSYAPAREALRSAAPIMVELITPQRVEPPKPLPPAQPPRRATKPVQRAAEPPPVITAPAESPTPAVAAPQPPPAPPAPIAAPGPSAPPVEVAITPPIFDADYLENPAPAYPLTSKKNGEQGRTILRVLVNARGGADEVQVRTSSGFARLDEAARDTVRRWRFIPAKRGVEPVPAWVLIPISFRLQG